MQSCGVRWSKTRKWIEVVALRPSDFLFGTLQLRGPDQSMCQMTYTVALEFTRTEWPRFWSWKNACFFSFGCVWCDRTQEVQLTSSQEGCGMLPRVVWNLGLWELSLQGPCTSRTLQYPRKQLYVDSTKAREVSCFRAAYILRRCHKIYQ